MESSKRLPNFNRISIISGSILLLLSLTPFIPGSSTSFEVSLPFFNLAVNLSLRSLIPFFGAVLAALGMEWLIEDHPLRENVRFPLYWVIPALAVLAIGLPLNLVETSSFWWIMFVSGGIGLILVLYSEYITLDPADPFYDFASLTLIAIMHAMLLGIALSVRASGQRLYVLLIVILPAVFFVTLRALFLRSERRFWTEWSVGITVFIAGLVIGLHYLPIPAPAFAMIIAGTTYALGALASGIISGEHRWELWLEPGIVTLVILVGAIFV